MAFPTTSVLDAFTRANAGTLGTNWTVNQRAFGDPNIGITSNAAKATAADASDYYNVATYGAACEAYATIATRPGDVNAVELHARIANPTLSTATFYVAKYTFNLSGTDDAELYSFASLTYTQLGATVTQDFNAGDKMGLECNGTTITFYRYNGTSWASVLSRTDSTITAAGYIGMYMQDTTVVLDDFGGGTIVAASTYLAPPRYQNAVYRM